MLSTMRQHSRSLLIYILFGIVIAVFIINFGPGSKGCGAGIAETYAAKVAGSTVPEEEFVHALQLLGFDQDSPEMAKARRQFLMGLIINREILAHEAEKLGIRVSKEEVEDRIADGHLIIVGVPRNIKLDPRFASIYRDGFDEQKFRQNFCQYFLHTTENKFIEEQRREVLADKFRDLVRATTKIGPEEVQRDFVDRETQVKVDFVRFGARRFEDETQVTPAEVDAYLQKNKDKVKETYDQRSFMYKAVPREVRVRGIFYNGTDAKAEGRANAAAERVKNGTDMAELAKKESDDARSKARGGDLGWKRKGAAGFGQSFDDKVVPMKKGDAPAVVKSDKGFWVLRVEDAREGDLPFDQVSHELAEDMLRRDKAAEKAKAEADAAMAKIKAGQKLEDLFPKAEEEKDQPTEAEQKKEAKKPAADPNAPKLQETAMFSRHGNALEDIGVSKDAAQAVFTQMKKGDVQGPFEIQGGTPSYVIVKVVDRKDPDMASFEKKRDDIAREAAASKWATVLNDIAHRRCVEARDAGQIRVNPEVLTLGQGDEPAGYVPCTGYGR